MFALRNTAEQSTARTATTPAMAAKRRSPLGLAGITLQNQVLRPGYLTLIQIAEKLGVSYAKIYRYIFEGKLQAKKYPSAKCFYP
jgi:hypothetical protein